jgi:hypothetical protein
MERWKLTRGMFALAGTPVLWLPFILLHFFNWLFLTIFLLSFSVLDHFFRLVEFGRIVYQSSFSAQTFFFNFLLLVQNFLFYFCFSPFSLFQT